MTAAKSPSLWRFCVAPMMDWTDRHCRFLHRQLTRRARLYTEMLTTGAVIHGDRARLLGFDPAEHPVALQLGGAAPAKLAEAARIGAAEGYDEINLNCGCPSDRVQDGRFGACLMREPALVGECVAAMKAAVGIPVTVKCRLGVDEQDEEAALDHMADAVVAAGADALFVHARKAWLHGLSPKENRDVPPLDYGRVFRLKARLPDVPIVLNGGIASVAEGVALLAPRDGATLDGATLDGVMLGRAAYHMPGDLLTADPIVFGEDAPAADVLEVVERMIDYASARLAEGARLSGITRHMLGLFQGVPGARRWRRVLTEGAIRPGADVAVIRDAFAGLQRGEPAAIAAE